MPRMPIIVPSLLAIALALPQASAAETPATDLATLQTQRDELDTKASERRGAVLSESALSDHKKAIESAKAALTKGVQEDAAITAAKQAVAEAEEALTAATAAAKQAMPELVAEQNAKQALAAAERRLAHLRQLADLYSRHPGSPARDAIAAAMQPAQAALTEAESAVKNDAEVQSAWATQSKDRQAVETARRSRDAEAQVADARKAERAADQALRDAQSADPRQAEYDALRKAHEKAIATAVGQEPDAAKAQARMQEINAQLAEPRAKIKPMQMLMDELRRQVGAGEAAEVSAARATLEQAQAAWDELVAKDANAGAIAEAKAAHETRTKVVFGSGEGQKLKAAWDAAEEGLQAVRPKLAELADAAAVDAFLETLRQARHIRWEARGAAQKLLAQDSEIAALNTERKAAEKAAHQAVMATEAGQSAAAALKNAKQKQREAVHTAALQITAYQVADTFLRDHKATEAALDFEYDLLALTYMGRFSDSRKAAESQEAVRTARRAAEQFRREQQANPTEAVSAAAKAREETRQASRTAQQGAAGNAALKEAEQRAKASQTALRQAETAARKAADLDGKRKAVDAARWQALAATEATAAIAKQYEELVGQLPGLREAAQKTKEAASQAGRAINKGDDPAIKAAQEALASKRKALKEAESSATITALRQAVKDAEKALSQASKELLNKDEAYAALRKQIGDIDKQLKEAKKAARKAEKAAAQPNETAEPDAADSDKSAPATDQAEAE